MTMEGGGKAGLRAEQEGSSWEKEARYRLEGVDRCHGWEMWWLWHGVDAGVRWWWRDEDLRAVGERSGRHVGSTFIACP
jgi:hypothetical protein